MLSTEHKRGLKKGSMDENKPLDENMEDSLELPEGEELQSQITEENEETSEEEPEVQPEKPESPEKERPEMSRRAQLRIQKLLAERADLKRQLGNKPELSHQGLDYSQALEADPETINQLEADRKQYAENAYMQGVQQAQSIQFHTRLEIDAPKIEARYKQLDKNSEEFNPGVADAINTMYLSTVGYDPQTDTVANPNLRYADYVESIFELVEATAGAKVARSTQNIARQAATTGLRPDGSSPKRMNLNQAPETMSDEELDAVIAMAVPQKKR